MRIRAPRRSPIGRPNKSRSIRTAWISIFPRWGKRSRVAHDIYYYAKYCLWHAQTAHWLIARSAAFAIDTVAHPITVQFHASALQVGLIPIESNVFHNACCRRRMPSVIRSAGGGEVDASDPELDASSRCALLLLWSSTSFESMPRLTTASTSSESVP